MIKRYCIGDTSTKRITRIVSCPEDTIQFQINTGEMYLESSIGNIKDFAFNETGDELIEFSEIEKEDILYEERLKKFPSFLETSLSDVELNTYIENYFLGRIDATTWRLENYTYLRMLAYPKIIEKADAEVKINSGIDEYVAEGNLQLQQYYSDCIDVKIRFAKE